MEDAVKEMLEHMASTLAQGDALKSAVLAASLCIIEHPAPGVTQIGDKVELEGKYVPHFKPGKELRDRANIYEE